MNNVMSLLNKAGYKEEGEVIASICHIIAFRTGNLSGFNQKDEKNDYTENCNILNRYINHEKCTE